MLEWVIVVEWDPLVRSLLLEWLEEIGVQVLSFGSLESLPEAVDVSLFIVGLGQVQQSHAELLRLLRARYPGVPLLGLSTQVRVGLGADSALARKLGVEMILPKPCERQELLSSALTLLGRRQG